MAVEIKDILYMLVKEFGLEREKLDERVRLQKILYLLHSFGLVKLGYGFSWYRYGPYSQDLVYDAYDVLKNRGHYAKQTQGYKFSDDTNKKIVQFRTAFASVLEDPKQLELVASIRFIQKTWYPDLNKENVFTHLKSHKEKFFDTTDITKAEAQRAFEICQNFSSN